MSLIKSAMLFIFGLILIFTSQYVSPYEAQFWDFIGWKPEITIIDFGIFKWTFGLTLASITLWGGIALVIISILRLLIL